MLSYLIIPAVIFFLILNVIFRIKIIKKYKALSSKQINIDPKLLFDRSNLNTYVAENYPEHEKEIGEFGRLLRLLMWIAIGGFLSILILYLVIKFV